MGLAVTMVRCPYCRERIPEKATRCKHCHADLTAISGKTKRWLARYNRFKFGFYTGVIFTVVLGLLTYFQFFYGD